MKQSLQKTDQILHNNLSRRHFLKGKFETKHTPKPIRPPWTNEERLLNQCSTCGECLLVCPEKILVPDENNHPQISFKQAACTFCGACADICPNPVFDKTQEKPWSLKVIITNSCLLKTGVTCQLCTDTCEVEALKFNLRSRPNGAVQIDNDLCSGCGACISTCPVQALSIQDDRNKS